MNKNFLIVTDEHPKNLYKGLEQKALQFTANKFGKDILDKVRGNNMPFCP